MIYKSLLLKPVTALAVVFFAVASWAAGISEEQEGTKLYCVKRIDAGDGEYLLQLSQQYGNYTSGSGEECFERWYSSAGGPSVHSTVADYLNSGDELVAIQLASDIDFGGYDENYQCKEEFRPFESEESVPLVAFMSADNSTYTIKGLCYINLYGGVTFGGDIINVMSNVRFENVYLESTQFAGLLSNVGDAHVANVSVERATVRAPIAGILSWSVFSLDVVDFVGSDIMINSVPQSDLSNVSFDRAQYVRIGGLAGTVNDITATGVHLSGLTISNNPAVEEETPVETFSQMVSSLETYVGGVVGVAQDVRLIQVGIESSTLMDHSSSGSEISSFVGGLVGGVMSMEQFQVFSTYTWSDITCSKDTSLCRAGYIAGLLKIDENPGSEMRVTSNFHYTQSESDVAIGMIGELYCAYASQYDQTAAQCADGFNRYGELPTFEYEDSPDIPVKSLTAFARGNYRSANSSLEQTSGFDPVAYTFADDDYSGFTIGVIDNSYMRTSAFAEALNNLDFDYGSGSGLWLFEESKNYPYMLFADVSPSDVSDFNMYRIIFRLDCIESGCLTDNEVAALVQFAQYKIGSYEYEFPTDEYGAIANQDWVDFAANLQEENPERDYVRWANASEDEESYKKFATNNKYSFGVSYKLEVGQAEGGSEEVYAYAFFGTGIDFDRTIVELSSYDGVSIENRGSEIDQMSYSGMDEPVVMLSGPIMRIYAIDPVTTDGSVFKGWVVKAAFAHKGDVEKIRKAAFGGMNIPVDEDGYVDLGQYEQVLFEKFERESLGDTSGVIGEIQKTTQMMQSEIQAGNYSNIQYYSAKLDSLENLMDSSSPEDGDVVLALAIFPKGFEDQNGIDPYPVDPNGGDEPQHDSVLVEVVYPALFQSGNAIQLAVKTDEFVYEESAPFVSVLLEDLSGEPLNDTLFEFSDGEWPETFTWEKFPLAPGRYLLTAKIYDGKNQNPDVRQWDFEVKAQIADECSDCWYMVSLSNVVLDKVNPSDVNVLYWWNEQSVNGKYWQYEEVERVSDVDRARGYWYNSIEDLPLELDGESLDDDFVVWEIDSVYSGWNMVRNPFGWYIDVSDLKRQGYAYYSWDSERGNYRTQPHYIKPYESFWVKTGRYEVLDLPSTPAFIDIVDADGNTVPYRALQKKQVLAKAAGAEDWNVQISLFDMKGKADTWNELGVGKAASALEEPPAGMGDHVNLTIVDAGRRLAKSVKEENGDAVYEWNMEISATSVRTGYLKVDGVDALRAYGLRAFLTVDGVTTELNDEGKVQVSLSATAKTATLRIASAARKVVASTLQGLRAHDLGTTLQVGFDVGEGLAGANARVDLVDMKGHVVNTAGFKAETGRNEISLERPVRGLYVLRAAVGREVAVQKILLK